jgi:NFACT protein RNA binding domain
MESRFFSFFPGNKVNNVDVVYTPWFNLKKTPSMEVGQVGFHNPKMVMTSLS